MPAHRLPVLAAVGVVLGLLLAGCTSVALPSAATPEKPGHAWTDTDAELWIARQTSCGECGVTTESGSLTLTLLYRDGAVLRARFGEGGQEQLEGYPPAEGDRRGLTFAFPAEHEAYRDEITAAWRALNDEEPHLVRVHDVVALRLDPTEREDVLRVVEHAVDQSDDLGTSFQADCPEDAACFDGHNVRYGAWGAPQQARATGPPPFGQDPDAAWRLLEEQVLVLDHWLDAGAATP